MMLRGPFLVLLAFGALLLPGGTAAQPTDLAGVWVFDPAASDTLELQPSDTAQTRQNRFRVGVLGGYPPQSRSIRDPQRMRDAVDAVSRPPERINIAQDDSTVTVSFDSAQPITLYPDGRKVRRMWLDDGEVRVRVRWEGRALRIERLLETQIEVLQTVERDGATLTITTIVEGPIPRRLEVRRVYRLERD